MNFFHWDGKPLLKPEVLDAIKCSRSLHLEDGSRLVQPGRDDYQSALRTSGILGSQEELVDRADLVGACQAHWHAHKCNSCTFSAYLSEERLEHGWETFIILEDGPTDELAEGVAELVAPRIKAPETEIISVVLANLEDEEALGAFLGRLGQLPEWSLVDLGDEDDAAGPAAKIGLRRSVELDYESEVLGFGPQPLAARTRQAPFTELAIRAKPPSRPKAHARAVMADVHLPALSGSEFASLGNETKALRETMLGTGHDQRGKAKVSFVISRAVWQGISP